MVSTLKRLAVVYVSIAVGIVSSVCPLKTLLAIGVILTEIIQKRKPTRMGPHKEVPGQHGSSPFLAEKRVSALPSDRRLLRIKGFDALYQKGSLQFGDSKTHDIHTRVNYCKGN